MDESKLNIVPSVCWIKRGVLQAKPTKVKLEPHELREIIGDPTFEQESEGEEEAAKIMERTAVIDVVTQCDTSDVDEVIDVVTKWDDDSDVEEQTENADEPIDKGDAPTLAVGGIAVFGNPRDDPYLTNPVDSDEESDVEDERITENDNMVVAIKSEDDAHSIVCFLYNHDEKDFYVHHHYDLISPALVVEEVSFDPGVEGSKGNLIAVGSMDSTIQIWDLDVIGPAPVVTFGKSDLDRRISKAQHDKRPSQRAHNSAVLSLAWSPLAPRVLVSGDADNAVIVWDLETQKYSSHVPFINGNAQSIQFHPTEVAQLLAGTMAGTVEVVDMINVEPRSVASWSFGGEDPEVNSVCWDPHAGDYIYVASEDGKVRYLDRRVPGRAVWDVEAHTGGVQALCVNKIVQNMIVTCGDECIKFWKKTAEGLQLAHTEHLSLGPLMSMAFNPDVAEALVVGGCQNEYIKGLGMTSAVVLKTLFGCTGCMAVIESLNKGSSRSMDLMTFSMFVFVACHGLVFTSKFFSIRNEIPIRSYVPIVVIFFLVNVANNQSLSYDIPVPLFIIFRSSSLVSNMIVEMIWRRTTYSTKKIMSIFVLTFGIVLFTMETVSPLSSVGDSNTTFEVKSKHATGLMLMTGALVFSSILGMYQEELHHKYGKHPEEAMFFVHFLSLPAFSLLWPSIHAGLTDAIDSPPLSVLGAEVPVPSALCKLLLICVFQFICVKNVYRLTSVTTSLNVTMVTTLRKFLSMLLSVFLFDSAFTIIHGVATVLVTLGTLSFYDVSPGQIFGSRAAEDKKKLR